MKSLLRIVMTVWLLTLLTGCTTTKPTVIQATPATPPVREVTRVVTREVVREVIVQQPPIEVPVTPTPRSPRKPCPTVPDYIMASYVITDTVTVDMEYYPAMLVVTQFFTYLDSRQYMDAYDLISPHLEDYGQSGFYKTKEQFISYYQDQYDQVCLYSVTPTLDLDPSPGVQSPEKLPKMYGLDESHYKQIRVLLATYGLGSESELYPSGQVRNVFFGVAKEDDGRWRIIDRRRYPGEDIRVRPPIRP